MDSFGVAAELAACIASALPDISTVVAAPDTHLAFLCPQNCDEQQPVWITIDSVVGGANTSWATSRGCSDDYSLDATVTYALCFSEVSKKTGATVVLKDRMFLEDYAQEFYGFMDALVAAVKCCEWWSVNRMVVRRDGNCVIGEISATRLNLSVCC